MTRTQTQARVVPIRPRSRLVEVFDRQLERFAEVARDRSRPYELRVAAVRQALHAHAIVEAVQRRDQQEAAR